MGKGKAWDAAELHEWAPSYATEQRCSQIYLESSALSMYTEAKKAWQALDHKAIVFLANQMRLKIKEIPKENDEGLVEIHTKFSDALLECFLQSEDMSVRWI